MALTQERLKELVCYDSVTGIFRWRENRYCGRSHKSLFAKAGDEAGSQKANIRNVYRTLTLGGVRYYAHRLAWLYVTGSFPTAGMDIDHVDADSLNNRFANLRCTTRAQNLRNSRKSNANKSGFKGVSWHKQPGKWRAVIKHNGRHVHLGYFPTPEEAHSAYVAKAREIFGEFARAA